MQTQTTAEAVAAVHTHLNALHAGEAHDLLADLLDDLVAAAHTGDQAAIDHALAAVHTHHDALHAGERHDALAEVLGDVVTAAQTAPA
ncbi:hypothetical protein ACFC0S_16220 [Streptomyces sp. NPDC056084]|uniref:hypothetical protein n=1 Tax=unclassified Streptomyces TaxID=2593676 RepID=UPI0035DCE8B4